MQDHRKVVDSRSGLKDLPDVILDQARQGLCSAKLGKLETWRIPEIMETIGPRDLEPFELHDAARRNIVSKVREKLSAYSDEQVAILGDPARVVRTICGGSGKSSWRVPSGT